MLSLIEELVPGTFQVIVQRYQILKEVESQSPIGRRALAKQVDLSERSLRTEIQVLKDQAFISTSSAGMSLTTLGIRILDDLEDLVKDQASFRESEDALAKQLEISQCIICRRDSQESLAQEALAVMDRLLPHGSQTIAVMGGTTMRKLAESFDESLSTNRTLQFLPARGGAGEEQTIQANAIADLMANRTHGTSRLLYAPDHVRSETRNLLLQEPEIKETMRRLSQADLAVFGIGDAKKMANRIGLDQATINQLDKAGAVAEAFGEFIDAKGEIVYKLARIGLSSEDIQAIPNLLAVAGGAGKAQAIEAYCKVAPSHTILVTDQAAANKILNWESSH